MELKLVPSGNEHRRFLLMHVAAAAVIAAVAFALAFGVATRRSPFSRYDVVGWLFAPATAYCLGLSLVLFACGAAWLCVLWHRRDDGHSFLPGAMQVVAYCSGLLLVWVLLAGGLVFAGVWIDRTLGGQARAAGVRISTLVFGAWTALHLVCAAWFLLTDIRGSSGVRYASR